MNKENNFILKDNCYTYFKCNGITLGKIKGYDTSSIISELHHWKYCVDSNFTKDIVITHNNQTIYSDGHFDRGFITQVQSIGGR